MAIHTTYGDWLEQDDVDSIVNTVTCVVGRSVLPMVSHYPGVGAGFWNCCARFQRVLWIDVPSAAHHGRRRWLWCSKGSLLPCTPAFSTCAPKCAPETPGLRCISALVCALVKAISHRGKRKRPHGRGTMRPYLWWCPGPESNRHALRRGILSPHQKQTLARLPGRFLAHGVGSLFAGWRSFCAYDFSLNSPHQSVAYITGCAQ